MWPGTTYTCRLLPPAPSIVDVLEALEAPLAVHDVEFVYIVGPSDSVDWTAAPGQGRRTVEPAEADVLQDGGASAP